MKLARIISLVLSCAFLTAAAPVTRTHHVRVLGVEPGTEQFALQVLSRFLRGGEIVPFLNDVLSGVSMQAKVFAEQEARLLERPVPVDFKWQLMRLTGATAFQGSRLLPEDLSMAFAAMVPQEKKEFVQAILSRSLTASQLGQLKSRVTFAIPRSAAAYDALTYGQKESFHLALINTPMTYTQTQAAQRALVDIHPDLPTRFQPDEILAFKALSVNFRKALVKIGIIAHYGPGAEGINSAYAQALTNLS